MLTFIAFEVFVSVLVSFIHFVYILMYTRYVPSIIDGIEVDISYISTFSCINSIYF